MIDTSDNIVQPDPAWDYYIEWHKLAQVKAKVEKLMAYIATIENSTDESDELRREDLRKIIELLESI